MGRYSSKWNLHNTSGIRRRYWVGFGTMRVTRGVLAVKIRTGGTTEWTLTNEIAINLWESWIGVLSRRNGLWGGTYFLTRRTLLDYIKTTYWRRESFRPNMTWVLYFWSDLILVKVEDRTMSLVLTGDLQHNQGR